MDEHHVVPETHRIQDLDGWLESNGIRGPDDDIESRGGPNLDQRDWAERLAESAAYIQSVHDAAFEGEKSIEDERQDEYHKRLKSSRVSVMNILTADGIIHDVPLTCLVSCDAVFAKLNSWNEMNDSSENTAEFSLESFPKSSVQEFIHALSSDAGVATISNDAIVDCCLMAHYVCSETMLHEIADVLVASIDTANCFSLCQMADELNLPTLFERSLAHMMDTIGDLETNEAYDDLTPELRRRIESIKTAIETSIHSRSRLYFGSIEEYISIFAERVQYYRERLAQAKEEQEQRAQFDRCTPGWYDTQAKIERQERRVQTLQMALLEQKKMFAKASSFTE